MVNTVKQHLETFSLIMLLLKNLSFKMIKLHKIGNQYLRLPVYLDHLPRPILHILEDRQLKTWKPVYPLVHLKKGVKITRS